MHSSSWPNRQQKARQKRTTTADCELFLKSILATKGKVHTVNGRSARRRKGLKGADERKKVTNVLYCFDIGATDRGLRASSVWGKQGKRKEMVLIKCSGGSPPELDYVIRSRSRDRPSSALALHSSQFRTTHYCFRTNGSAPEERVTRLRPVRAQHVVLPQVSLEIASGVQQTNSHTQ